jgi:putative transcriptional regulator
MMALKLRRISQGLKQKDLAEKVGICKQYLADLENGRANNPSKNLMERLAAALNSSVPELFFGEKEG